MEIYLLLTEFLLGFTVFLYLLWPLINDANDNFPVVEDMSEERKKNKVLEALSDLEYEHETGKIDSADYQRLRDHYLTRAAKIFDDDDLTDFELETADSDSDHGDQIEERIARRKEKLN